MILDELKSENDKFKYNINNILIPQIIERINNGEIKVEYSLFELKSTLSTDYRKENLNIRLRNILYDSEIGVSIKRNMFIFFKKENGINRETDLFKVKFEKNIPTIASEIEKESLLTIEEICFKSFFKIDYNIDNIYQRIRSILSKTNLKVKIEKNVIVDGKNTNILVFYDKNKVNDFKQKYERNVIIDYYPKEINDQSEKVDDHLKEEFIRKEEIEDEIKRTKAESKLLLESFKNEEIEKLDSYCEKLTNDLPCNIPLPYTIICVGCKNKVILKYPEIECPLCKEKILNGWEFIDE